MAPLPFVDKCFLIGFGDTLAKSTYFSFSGNSLAQHDLFFVHFLEAKNPRRNPMRRADMADRAVDSARVRSE
jgi:hypothetical protein